MERFMKGAWYRVCKANPLQVLNDSISVLVSLGLATKVTSESLEVKETVSNRERLSQKA